MQIQLKPTMILSVMLLAGMARADSVVYVINGNQQFGEIDISTGAFQQVGPNTPEGSAGLVRGANGSLLTLTYSGNLDSINPTTGATSVVGATGLADCTTPASPCGPTSANNLSSVGGKLYATDYANNLYQLNPVSGSATLIGATGIPGVPFISFTMNPDGSTNLFDSSLFAAGGKLYGTFDAFTYNFSSSSLVSVVVAPKLFEIDPLTGIASIVGATSLGIGAVADVNGTYYAFDDLTNQILTLDLTSGNTTVSGSFDSAAGVIAGAESVPEPSSVMLTVLGSAAVFLLFILGRTRTQFGGR